MLNHYVATTYVYDRHKSCYLLVLHRKLGVWLPPGGHLDSEEIPHEGALRELFEEVGVRGEIVSLVGEPYVNTPQVPQLPTPFCILKESIPKESEGFFHFHIDFVYVVEILDQKAVNNSERELSLVRWFTLEEVKNLDTYENVKAVCAAIKDSIDSQRLLQSKFQ